MKNNKTINYYFFITLLIAMQLVETMEMDPTTSNNNPNTHLTSTVIPASELEIRSLVELKENSTIWVNEVQSTSKQVNEYRKNGVHAFNIVNNTTTLQLEYDGLPLRWEYLPDQDKTIYCVSEYLDSLPFLVVNAASKEHINKVNYSLNHFIRSFMHAIDPNMKENPIDYSYDVFFDFVTYKKSDHNNTLTVRPLLPNNTLSLKDELAKAPKDLATAKQLLDDCIENALIALRKSKDHNLLPLSHTAARVICKNFNDRIAQSIANIALSEQIVTHVFLNLPGASLEKYIDCFITYMEKDKEFRKMLKKHCLPPVCTKENIIIKLLDKLPLENAVEYILCWKKLSIYDQYLLLRSENVANGLITIACKATDLSTKLRLINNLFTMQDNMYFKLGRISYSDNNLLSFINSLPNEQLEKNDTAIYNLFKEIDYKPRLRKNTDRNHPTITFSVEILKKLQNIQSTKDDRYTVADMFGIYDLIKNHSSTHFGMNAEIPCEFVIGAIELASDYAKLIHHNELIVFLNKVKKEEESEIRWFSSNKAVHQNKLNRISTLLTNLESK